ncbi:DUF695 domain-containing protein [Persicimonas caeni]|uniref:DUF695 domain-containing protein n=1 Tax=Persicimonas caeni TaxID=2292766 RepID=A0A4Y6Q008_PERCE|nr:DUF695 domain-containing protein [Persicimonas caeni]QDG53928.1 DUF695 domain-containing protein [Persicimonas caeni]QED35149.1 DUF695 domain-containing protein [Persicimonas caeni]
MTRQFVTAIATALAVVSFSAMGCSTAKDEVRETPAPEKQKLATTKPSGPLPPELATESERWEVYARYGTLKPQIVVVDAGLEADKLAGYLPQLVRVRVSFPNPDPSGMPDRKALGWLNEISDFLHALAQKNRWSIPGWVTHDGVRDFYVYGPSELTKALPKAVRDQYPEIDVAFEAEQEPAWETYQTLLYPRPVDWQVISNQRVIQKLRDLGDTLQTPRKVMHWAHFPSEEARESFAETLDEFEVDEMSKADDSQMPYAVRFSHTTSVEPPVINPVTIRLMRLAAAHGGEYDGWETSVTTQVE